MTLKELFRDFSLPVGFEKIASLPAHLTSRSHQVQKNGVFAALKGAAVDGHQFIPQAIQKGAAVIVAESAPQNLPKDVIFVEVPDTLKAFSILCERYFKNSLSFIGVTGTNGKTTTAFLIQHILNQTSKCGLIGTIFHDTLKRKIEASNTTPGLEELHELFGEMTQVGAKFCVMEVSSHALKQRRVEGLNFSQSIFTNLTQDHLDYHITFEDYFESKKKLFTEFPKSCAIVNADDPYGARLLSLISNPTIRFGISQNCEVKASNIQAGLDGVCFQIIYKGEQQTIQSRLVGLFNVYNLLAAISSVTQLGISLKSCAQAIETFPGVKGRMERIDQGQSFYVFVDYAHTPDAVENVLKSVKPLAKGRIITVFGCGGNRDRLKRPLMGEIAGRLSDVVFLTSDNPRKENPKTILEDVKSGLQTTTNHFFVEIDRKQAIEQALKEAKPHDAVLILGKGHEEYQILGEQKIHFSDQETVREILTHQKSTSLSHFPC